MAMSGMSDVRDADVRDGDVREGDVRDGPMSGGCQGAREDDDDGEEDDRDAYEARDFSAQF